MSRSMYPELLAELANNVANTIKTRMAVSDQEAADIGDEVADKMAFTWGGQSVYIPQGMSWRINQRDIELYNNFTGDNHSELARKYGVSLQCVYAVVKKVRYQEMKRRQPDLFPEPNSDD